MSLEQGQKSHQQCLNPCTPSAFPWDQRLQSASADREHIKFKAIVTNSGNGLKKNAVPFNGSETIVAHREEPS